MLGDGVNFHRGALGKVAFRPSADREGRMGQGRWASAAVPVPVPTDQLRKVKVCPTHIPACWLPLGFGGGGREEAVPSARKSPLLVGGGKS